MPQSLSKILIHLAFSTKGRAALLPQEPFEDLRKYAAGIFKEQASGRANSGPGSMARFLAH
jgi:hypothetical protein